MWYVAILCGRVQYCVVLCSIVYYSLLLCRICIMGRVLGPCLGPSRGPCLGPCLVSCLEPCLGHALGHVLGHAWAMSRAMYWAMYWSCQDHAPCYLPLGFSHWPSSITVKHRVFERCSWQNLSCGKIDAGGVVNASKPCVLLSTLAIPPRRCVRGVDFGPSDTSSHSLWFES